VDVLHQDSLVLESVTLSLKVKRVVAVVRRVRWKTIPRSWGYIRADARCGM
jgi:hypothetical protein